MRRSEHKRYKYLKQSPQLDSRSKLLEVARSVCAERSLHRTTLHLAVYILDTFMDVFEISHERLRLFSVVCVLIASKIEDRSECVPRWEEIQQFLDPTNQAGPRECRILECMILNSLNWRVGVPTAATFMEYYIDQSITVQDVQGSENSETVNLKNLQMFKDLRLIMYNLIYYLLDLSLNEVALIGVLPSKLAAASILCARFLLSYEPIWTINLANVTGYVLEDVIKLAKELLVIYKVDYYVQKDLDLNKCKKRQSGYNSSVPPEKISRKIENKTRNLE